MTTQSYRWGKQKYNLMSKKPGISTKEIPCFLNQDRTFTMPPDTLLPARNTMHSGLQISLPPSLMTFDIPHIFERICTSLSKTDLMACCSVSFSFYSRFNPWLWRKISIGFKLEKRFSRAIHITPDGDDPIKALFRNGYLVRRLEIMAFPTATRLAVFNSGFTLIPTIGVTPTNGATKVELSEKQRGVQAKSDTCVLKAAKDMRFREVCPNIQELLIEIEPLLGSGWARQETDTSLQIIQRMQQLRHLELINVPIELQTTSQNIANVLKSHQSLETVSFDSLDYRITKDIFVLILQSLPKNIRNFSLKVVIDIGEEQESESILLQESWPVYHGLTEVALEGPFNGSDKSSLIPFLEWSSPNIQRFNGPKADDPRIVTILKLASAT